MNDGPDAESRPQDPCEADAEVDVRALQEALAEAEAIPGAVSHELRSPIGALLILGSLLSKDYGDTLDERGRELLKRMNDCAQNTVALMDRLMLFAHIRQQTMNPVPLDMGTEIQSVFTEQALRHGGQTPVLRLRDLPDVVADAVLMRLLLANLVANAVKCTTGRPDPCIEAGGETGVADVTFFVRDNGIGFEPRQSARLFTLFGRVHPQVKYPGAGIGLAIVQRIARRHGGRVWASAVPGEGATFHVALPRSPRQVASTALPAE